LLCFYVLQEEQTLAFAQFEKEQWQQHFSNVTWENFENDTVKRQLRTLSVLGVSALDNAQLSEVRRLCTANCLLSD
jgi:hypothetical protein